MVDQPKKQLSPEQVAILADFMAASVLLFYEVDGSDFRDSRGVSLREADAFLRLKIAIARAKSTMV